MKEIILTLLGFFVLLESFPLARKVGLEDICGISAMLCVVLIIVIIILVVLLIIFLVKEVFDSSNQQTTVVQTPQQQSPPPQQTRRQQPILSPSSRKSSKNCPDCGERMRYIEEHRRWFCEDCKEYKWLQKRSAKELFLRDKFKGKSRSIFVKHIKSGELDFTNAVDNQKKIC